MANRDWRRPWCAVLQYKGKKEFTIGTVFAGTEEMARLEIIKTVPEYLPDGYEILRLIPGVMFFSPEDLT